MTYDLKQQTLRGATAKVGSQGANFVIRVGSLVILARLLDPTDFGLLAMVTVVTGVFNLFRDAGLSLATVQRERISEAQLSTLFWVNIAVGLLLSAGTIAAAPFLVMFYHEPRLQAVALALSLGFVLNAAGVQHSALLQRQMRFGTIAAIETTGQILSSALGIVLALLNLGYWSLVCMALTLTCVSTAGCWMATGWIPGRPRSGTDLRSLIRFGGTVTLNSLIVYAAYNLDKILLGRFWGAAPLGVYGRAYQLVSIPTDNLNSAVGGVALSALSRLQNDLARLRSYFLKGYSIVLVLTIPLTLMCAVFAEDIIVVLLGGKWVEAAPLFRRLAPTILAFALLNPLSWLLIATGNLGRSLKMALVIAPVVALGYIIGLPAGPKGVALGFSTSMLLLTVPLILWATHGLIVTKADIMSAVLPPFVSALVATLLAFAIITVFGHELNRFVRLVIECFVLGSSYLAMLLLVMKQWSFYSGLMREFLVGGKQLHASHV
jgi:O-antigen/teichoic acid export membrane protein